MPPYIKASKGMLLADHAQSASTAAPSFSRRGASRKLERQAQAAGHKLVAGVDEAGRGALAGPVVAAAVILPSDQRVAYVVDSKQLNPHQREYLYQQITATAVSWAVGVVGPQQIDATNILKATHQAMQQALDSLNPSADFALIDGRFELPIPLPQWAIIDGDNRCYCIAAASIVAKVYRDWLMEYLARLYPQYGFEHNRGYGTPDHLQALEECGPCPVHRRSFAPVQQYYQGRLVIEFGE